MITLHTLTIGDVMVKNVIAVHVDQTVRHAATVMSEKEIGCLVVLDGKKVVGIVTEQDLIRRVVAINKDPNETLVGDVMSTPPVVVKPRLSLEDAIKLMFMHKIKKLIVIQDEDKDRKLVGIVTLTDIARIEPLLIKTLKTLFDENMEIPPRRIEKVMNYYIV
jgi:CBS domain-containing protein